MCKSCVNVTGQSGPGYKNFKEPFCCVNAHWLHPLLPSAVVLIFRKTCKPDKYEIQSMQQIKEDVDLVGAATALKKMSLSQHIHRTSSSC